MEQRRNEDVENSASQTYLGFRIPDRLHLRIERMIYLRNQAHRMAGKGRFYKNQAAIEALELWLEREEGKYRKPATM